MFRLFRLHPSFDLLHLGCGLHSRSPGVSAALSHFEGYKDHKEYTTDGFNMHQKSPEYIEDM
jgi:hypothetical protein